MRTLPVAIAELLAEPEGSRRLGQFALVKQLGRGGFAPVWSAREEYAGKELRTVAVKLFSLAPDDTGYASSVEQLLEEARTLCRVEHPNVVRFHSVVIDSSRKVAACVMEHLAGTSLDRQLDERTLSLAEVVEVGLAVASALSAVHRAGLVHRDVKPGNIIETPSGYKLIDFGVAFGGREAQRPSGAPGIEVSDVLAPPSRHTRLSTLSARSTSSEPRTLEVEIAVGTMGYIDPECIAYSRPATPASDLYALGATLFELLTGHVPAGWDGKVLRGEVMDGRKLSPPLAELLPEIDPNFSELVRQLLAASRGKRPSSAEWVVTRLEQLRHSLAGRHRELPSEAIGPFRGLSRFEASDRGVYFGRSLEIAQALQVLRVRGLVALLGPSGSGKSSLARAGLLPAIADGLLQTWPAQWDTLSMTPGIDPRRTLLELLEPIVTLEPDATQAEVLAALGARVERSARGVVLLVDQLEELATVSERASRDWLAELLALSAEHAVPGFKLVVTARRDLLDPLLELTALGRVLLRNSLLVEAISGVTWADVLDQALAAYGYRCEDQQLRAELVREIERTSSAMPLVGFALERLWEMRDRGKKIITREALSSLGGISGALAQHAQGTFERLTRDDADKMRAARRVLLALTTARGTRTSKTDAELRAIAGADAVRVVMKLEDARLLLRTPTGLTIAHEALIDNWQLMRSWVAEEQESRSLAEELEQDAARYRAEPEAVPLWPRRRLANLAEVLSRGDVEISAGGRAFLEASRRAEWRRRALAGGAALAAFAVAAVGTVSYISAINTERGNTSQERDRALASKKIAEEKTREVQAAQQRIDELLRNVADSPTKDAVRELQRSIRGPAAAGPVTSPALRAAAVAREAPPRPSVESAQPGPAAVAAPAIKVQADW